MQIFCNAYKHLDSLEIVFCCIVAWIQPDISDCCLKMKSVVNILGYIRGFVFRQKKSSLNQNVRRDHAIM